MPLNIVNMASPTWNKSASYGRLAHEGRDYLVDLGVRVNTIGKDAPNRLFAPSFHTVFHGYPSNFNAYGLITRYGKRIAVTMFESSELPYGWIEPLNTLDEVIVPCKWNKEVFENSGVKVPIKVVPLGVSKAFQYTERKQKDVFRFLTIADHGQRKGSIEAICAFVNVFGNREDVELVVKARNLNARNQLLRLSNRNIRIINEDYTDEQMNRLYGRTDCLLFPARGEGFAMPPREFAVTGGISICTNHGGMADEIEHWGIGIDYMLVPAWSIPPTNLEHFRHIGQWAMPDMDELSQKILDVYNLPFDQRIQMGKRFSEYARSQYAWDAYGSELVNSLEGVAHAYPSAV